MLNLLIPMLSKVFQFFIQQTQLLYSRSKFVVILLLLAFCVSCSSSKPPQTDLKINVQSATRPGLYNVTGSTNLPDQSQITVTAIRYLPATDPQLLGLESDVSYSILDRQIVEVAQGKWETNLNLWQVAPDGRLQEAWQIGASKIGISLNPSNEVSFIATFDPAAHIQKSQQPQQQQQQQQQPTPDLEGTLVRFTSEGLPYVKASKTLQIPLPAGRRPPPGLKPEDINGGWGNRYEIKPQPPVTKTNLQSPKTDQTNAPLSPSEYLR